MDGWTDSPCSTGLCLLRFPPEPLPCSHNCYHYKIPEQGKGTDDHLLPLVDWFLLGLGFNDWAGCPPDVRRAYLKYEIASGTRMQKGRTTYNMVVVVATTRMYIFEAAADVEASLN